MNSLMLAMHATLYSESIDRVAPMKMSRGVMKKKQADG